MSPPTCQTCRFWAATDAARMEGRCHRLPPYDHAAPSGQRPGRGLWHWTLPDDWCGEHRAPETPPKPKAQPKPKGKGKTS